MGSWERRRYDFVAAFAMIGLGLGFLVYTFGFSKDFVAVGFFIGAGIGLLIDIMIENKK